MGYYIGLDAGQTVTKAVVFDESLAEVASARASSPNVSPEPRFVERSHEDLWAAASGALREALSKAQVSSLDVKGIGVAGHGDGLHLLDSRGDGVGACIMAVDSRAGREMDGILADPDRSKRILHTSGQVPFLGSPGVIMAWVANNRPDLLDQASVMVFCKDVIRNSLTGSSGTDFSDASASFLDVAKARWSTEVLEDYGLSDYEHLLPPLSPSSEIVGAVTSAAAEATGLAEGTAMVSGCHDVHAAALGMGSLREDTLTLITGSFSINAVTTMSDAVDPRWQSRASLTPGLRMAMSTSATASTSFEWALRTLGAPDEAARDALLAEASQIGLSENLPLFLPYIYASPFGDAPSGTFLGLRSWHTQAHLVKSVLEGLLWMHLWHTDALSESFTWSGSIRLGGGVSRSPLFCQMVADATEAVVETVETEETGAFGAAALAALGTGRLSSIEEVAPLVRVKTSFEPSRDGVEYWRERKALFYSSHDALWPIWRQMAPRG